MSKQDLGYIHEDLEGLTVGDVSRDDLEYYGMSYWDTLEPEPMISPYIDQIIQTQTEINDIKQTLRDTSDRAYRAELFQTKMVLVRELETYTALEQKWYSDK